MHNKQITQSNPLLSLFSGAFMRSFFSLFIILFAGVVTVYAQGDYTPVSPAWAKDSTAQWSVSETTPYGPVFTNGQHYGDVKFKGVIYGFYAYNMNSTAPASFTDNMEPFEPLGENSNEFELGRVYLTAFSQQSPTTAWRITTDVFRGAVDPATITPAKTYTVPDTGAAGLAGKSQTITVPAAAAPYYNGLDIRLKYAYFDWKPLSSLTFRFGMQQTPWISMVEDCWKYRGVELTASDMHGFTSSSDLGASLTWALPEKYGDLGAYVFNGQGYQKPEFDRFKDVAFRLQVFPMPNSDIFKNFKISGYYYLGTVDASPTDAPNAIGKPSNTTGVLAWWNYDIYNIGVEWDTHTTAPSNTFRDSTNTASIISIFAEVRGPGDLSDWALFGRYDMWNPTNSTVGSVAYPTATSNPSTTNTKANFLLVGLSYKMSAGMYLSLNYHGTTFASAVLPTYPNYTAPSTTAGVVNLNGATATDARLFVSGVLIF